MGTLKRLRDRAMLKSGVWVRILRFRRRPDRLTGVDLSIDLSKIVSRPNPVCFDVGANVGQTIDLLTRSLNHPKILAVEPSTETFKILQQKVKRKFAKADVKLFNVAVGAASGSIELINFKNSCLNSVLEMDRQPENNFQNEQEQCRETVKLTTIDDLAKQESLDRIDLLKIDTQRFDLEVLKGAKGMMAAGKIRNVLVEQNFVPMYQNQGNASDMQSFLLENGFHLIGYYETARVKHTIAWCTALYGRRDG
jgi:FkbM family methyltransferase